MNGTYAAGTANARIMIVDDETAVREVLRGILTDNGYTVESVKSATEAILRLQEVPPDLVLLDIVLPDRSGFEVCRHIRNTEGIAELPVILMTGYGDKESRKQGIEAAADDFLTKPIDPTEFVQRVSNIIELSRYRSLVEERRRRHRLEATLRSVEYERRQLAQEIHDELGQGLTALQGVLDRARGDDPDPELLGTLLDNARELSAHLLDATRRIASNLRPALLDDLGLCATLSWLCRRMGESYPTTSFVSDCTIDEEALDDDLRTAVFRICQEGVNNAVRHSGATEVTLRLTSELLPAAGAIALEISDNGFGFDVTRAEGLGLMGMRERAEHSGGRLRIDSREGRGTTISVTWPGQQ
jgi:signal transduction histidine kinase